MNRSINRITARRAHLAAPLAVAALTVALAAAKPAAAQLFLTSGTYNATDSTYANSGIYAGQASNGATSNGGVPYVATINVPTNGSVGAAYARNTSTINVTGGTINSYTQGLETSTVNISSGTVNLAEALNSSTTNISGGAVTYADANNTAKLVISGGTVTDGLFLLNQNGGGTVGSTVDFKGTNLTSKYIGYGNSNRSSVYADSFTVSGFSPARIASTRST